MSVEQKAIQLPEQASATSLILHGDAFDRIERMADIMASGKSTIPVHLRNKGDCMAVIMQSMQWGMSPIAVAQKTHLVNGVLGYEAQLVAAVINNSGVVRDRFHFEWFGDWSKVVGRFKQVESRTKKDDNGNPKKYIVPDWDQKDEQGLGVKVWATIRGESEPRVLELLMTQARTRNSTLWTEDPKQQIAYLAQKRWARLYAPDVILGVYTTDELQEIDMGTAERVEEPRRPAARQELGAYPDDRLEKQLARWKAEATGDNPAETIIATLSSKYTLTDAQKARIRAEVKAPTAVVDAEVVECGESTDDWDKAYDNGTNPQEQQQ